MNKIAILGLLLIIFGFTIFALVDTIAIYNPSFALGPFGIIGFVGFFVLMVGSVVSIIGGTK